MHVWIVSAIALSLFASEAPQGRKEIRLARQPQMELQVKNVEIDPAPAGVSGPTIELLKSRSYRVIVSIGRGGEGEPAGAPTFVVRTECVAASGDTAVLGEVRIGPTRHSGWNLLAAYNVFPGEAAAGPCSLRTIVDADNEVAEPDESPTSNVWMRNAVIK